MENLKIRAQEGLGDLGPEPGVPDLDELGQVVEPGVPDLDELGQVVARLAVADTLLAADLAARPAAGREAQTALAQSIDRLSATGRELEALAKPPPAGFAPAVPASPNAGVAADRLRRQARKTLDVVLDHAVGLVQDVRERVIAQPQQAVRDALKVVGATIPLEDWSGELATLARRLVQWVLDRLSRLIPPQALRRLRRGVGELLEATDLRHGVAVVLGVPRATEAIEECLARPGLDRTSLDHGTAGLAVLADGYGRKMSWAGRSTAAVALLADVVPVASVTLIVPLLFVTVLCATTVIAARYVGSGHGHDRSVRSIVARACEPGS